MKRSPVSRSGKFWAFVVLALALALHIGRGLTLVNRADWTVNTLYAGYAERIAGGARPYQDLHFEYPPAAIPILLVPKIVKPHAVGYAEAYRAWMLLWDMSILVSLGWLLRHDPRRASAAVALYGVCSLILFNLALARYDLVPAALAMWAVALSADGRPMSGVFAAGLGTAVKAWPAALLPLVWPATASSRIRWRRILAVWLLPIALSVLAEWWMVGDGPWSAAGLQARRGLQVETLFATPFLVASQLGRPIQIVADASGASLAGFGAALARAVTIYGVLLPGYVLMTVAFLRRRCDPGLSAVALIGWIVATAPVLSPQFLIWLLPVAAFAAADRAESLLLVAASGLTLLIVRHYEVMPLPSFFFVAMVTARNVTLVTWVALAIRSAWSATPGRRIQ